MGQAVPVRADYTASEVRRFARRAKDGAQARRLLALAAVLDGASREEAAKIGGMDRQTLRDWVIRYNEQGPDGLINIPSPGAPRQARRHAQEPFSVGSWTKARSLRSTAWCAGGPAICIMRLHDEFRLSVSDDTIYRPEELGFSHVSAGRRPTSRTQTP